jgi:two-component system copper resistance phosphate regulon response regulator CusR/two-component system response regulator QseB
LSAKLSLARLLVVEDEFRMASFLKKQLAEHFSSIECVSTCADALDAAGHKTYDAIVLDVGLPDGNGFDLLQRWRESGYNEPVLILSARDSVDDCVKGLDCGADDYLAKPFILEELLARLRSLLRRQGSVRKTVFEHRGLRLDILGRTVSLHDHLLELTSREYALLEIFIQNPGRILSRELICERIWDSSRETDANLLDVYMSRLRAKLQRSSGECYFRTVRGVGYQLLPQSGSTLRDQGSSGTN